MTFEYPDLLILLNYVEANLQTNKKPITKTKSHGNYKVRETVAKIKELLEYKYNEEKRKEE